MENTRTFIQERCGKWDELLQIDTESGAVKIYSVDKELGFPFSEYYTTAEEMGYKSICEMIKAMNSKPQKKEIDTAEQTKKELDGLVKLAQCRTERNKHFYMILNNGKLYNDIVERLQAYGLSEAEALEKILLAECGKFENNCNTCPYNVTCNRYASITA